MCGATHSRGAGQKSWWWWWWWWWWRWWCLFVFIQTTLFSSGFQTHCFAAITNEIYHRETLRAVSSGHSPKSPLLLTTQHQYKSCHHCALVRQKRRTKNIRCADIHATPTSIRWRTFALYILLKNTRYWATIERRQESVQCRFSRPTSKTVVNYSKYSAEYL